MPHSMIVRRALAGLAAIAALAAGAVVSGPGEVAHADGAPSTPFRAFIPGLSGDSTTPASPVTSVSPLVVTQNITTWLPGGLWVNGEVHNGLDTPITSVKVTASAADPGGGGVVTRTARVAVDTISPGQNGPFRILLPGAIQPGLQVSTRVAGYTVSAIPSINDQLAFTAAGPRPLEIVTADPVKHILIVTISDNLVAIDGTIVNNSNQAIIRPQAFVAVYDGAGRVAMISNTVAVNIPYQADLPVLGPGQSGTFTVLVPIPDFYQIQGQVRLAGFLGAAVS